MWPRRVVKSKETRTNIMGGYIGLIGYLTASWLFYTQYKKMMVHVNEGCNTDGEDITNDSSYYVNQEPWSWTREEALKALLISIIPIVNAIFGIGLLGANMYRENKDWFKTKSKL